MHTRALSIFILVLTLILLTACAPADPGTAGPSAQADLTATPQDVAGDATPTPVISAAAIDAEAEAGPSTLLIWMPEVLAPGTETPAGAAFTDRLSEFDSANPDVQVTVEMKRVSGDGSMLAYLRTAPAVAPSVLPDIALMSYEAIQQAAREDLIVAVEPLITPEQIDALYPVAVDFVTVEGQVMAIPYVLEIQHAAYRNTIYTETSPTSYETILEAEAAFDFPAATLTGANGTILSQYLAGGGLLIDENGSPTLSGDVLTGLLTFYADAREANLIDPAVFQTTQIADSWVRYTERQTNFTVTTSTLYLASRDDLRNTNVIAVPSATGSPLSLASGWAWVVTTTDVERQQMALDMIAFLMAPSNHGIYTQAAGWLPSQPGALAVWGEDDTYAAFADTLLANAVVRSQMSSAAASAILQDAFEAVLLNGESPTEAATFAIETVSPAGTSSP